MADQKFIFVGDRGFFGSQALEYGTPFDADPDFVRGQNFPAVPAGMLAAGHTKLAAASALAQFHASPGDVVATGDPGPTGPTGPTGPGAAPLESAEESTQEKE